ncbi:hypothetical protein LBMAG42_08330 [Deltaproteobacteria bacterium]|nr:hypothetical protein LBMAG42_08330 [Deltaproteobacteria bacterium]
MRTWELVCVIAGLAAGLFWWRARGSPRLAKLLLRIPERSRRWAGGWRGDLVMVVLALAVHVPALLHTWQRLGAGSSPIGPDSDENYLGAVSFLTDNPALYPSNRFPGFPWLMAAVAGDRTELAASGAQISMVAAVASGVGAYLVGRQLVGRAAGLAALVIVLRLPVVSDLGRQATPYMLAATLDLFTVAGVIGLMRGRAWCALPVAVCTGVALTLDPKQAPFIVAEVALAALAVGFFAARTPGYLRVSWLGCLAVVLAAMPVANALGAACGRKVLSVEEIVWRAPVGMEVGEMTAGWGLGAPLSAMPETFLEISREVSPGSSQGWFAQWARESVPLEFPDTSLGWLLAAVSLPVALAVRSRWRALPVVAILPWVAIAEPSLHLYFQHRYFVPVAVVLPMVVASGIGAAAGPAAVLGVLAAAVLLPGSPWAVAGPGLYRRWSPEAEAWTPADPGQWARLTEEAGRVLPPDARVYDYAGSRPWVALAGQFPYLLCTKIPDSCEAALTASREPIVAVLYLNEPPSHLLPQTDELVGTAYPEQLGRCWERRLRLGHAGAAYLWTCESPPVIAHQPPMAPPR